MNAVYGFNFPKQTASKSSSVIVKVLSAFTYPTETLPYPFFKSITHDLTTGPVFVYLISKLNYASTFLIKSFPYP